MLASLFAVLLMGGQAAGELDGRIDPTWARQPTAEGYPSLAGFLELPGDVMLQCYVSRPGPPEDCEVKSASPEGLGFEAFALRSALNGRLTPKLVEWKPQPRAPIRFTMRFRMRETPPYSGPQPTDEAMALAREYIRVVSVADDPPCVIVDVAEDRRARVQSWVDELLPCGSEAFTYAETLRVARLLTVAQLAELNAGKSIKELVSREQFFSTDMNTEELTKVRDELVARYCALYECSLPAD